jgi:hypothetical protein
MGRIPYGGLNPLPQAVLDNIAAHTQKVTEKLTVRKFIWADRNLQSAQE